MSTQQNKAAHRRLIEECFGKGDLALIAELVAADYVNRDDNLHGLEELRGFVGQYRAAFPDLRFTIDDQVAEGDRVATSWTARGTHRGELMGIPPTGKSAVVKGTSVARFADGKVVEEWGNWDRLGLMQQLGVIPAPAEAMR